MIYPAGSVGAAMADAEKQLTTADVSPDAVPVTQTAPIEKLDPAVAWPFPAAKPDDFEIMSLKQE